MGLFVWIDIASVGAADSSGLVSQDLPAVERNGRKRQTVRVRPDRSRRDPKLYAGKTVVREQPGGVRGDGVRLGPAERVRWILVRVRQSQSRSAGSPIRQPQERGSRRRHDRDDSGLD